MLNSNKLKVQPTRKHKAFRAGNEKIADPHRIVKDVFFAICKRIDTPVSLGAWLRFRDDQTELSDFSVDPKDYLDPTRFQNDYFVSEYLSKYKGLNTRHDCRGRAREAFQHAESQCKDANEIISKYRSGNLNLLPDVERVILHAQRKIYGLLGDFVSLPDILRGCKWGTGSSFSLRGEDACIDNKLLESQLTVTRRAAPYLRAAMSFDLPWLRARGVNAEGPTSLLSSEFKLVDGCRSWFVPKNAKIDRAIAIEPTGNIFLQLAVGAHLRHLLLRVGVDLNDQSLNQSLAARAYSEGLATIDLKAASDTICRELVFLLLPPMWACLLDDFRSTRIHHEGEWVDLEKFSSMGNGFTFELESLIFWAITSAVIELTQATKTIGIYGDDIICSSTCVPLIQRVFTTIGFTLNVKKTHWKTAFRESCGKHYFGGVDVTPVYQKEVPSKLNELYRLCNRLRRYECDRSDGYDDSSPQKAAWSCAVRSLPKKRGLFLHTVPIECQGYVLDTESYLAGHSCTYKWSIIRDDDGLALSEDELLAYRWNGKLPVLSFRASKRDADGGALLAYILRFGQASPSEGKVSLRRRGTFSSRRRVYPVGRQFENWALTSAPKRVITS